MVFLSKKPGFGSSRQVNPDNAVDPLPLPFSIIDEAVGTSGHQDTNQDTKRLRKIWCNRSIRWAWTQNSVAILATILRVPGTATYGYDITMD